MKRLLCIISCMNTGGAETFLMKIYRSLDRVKYQMDFCVNTLNPCYYKKEIEELGGHIYCIPSKSSSLSSFTEELSKIVSEKNYKYVLRITSNCMGFYDLKVAKKAGASVCVARSSNSSDGGGVKTLIAHRFGRLMYRKYVDVALAPSDVAAIYTFGKNSIRDKKVIILNNGLDTELYSFKQPIRVKYRCKLGIENSFVVGHIGRFTRQKNHVFLIDIFAQIKQKKENAVLLLIGQGELENEIRNKINEVGLENNVKFLGIRKDIPALLSAMDVFVFPSLYEGMPNTVIEAQASGLPCVIADTITREAAITEIVKFLPLSSQPETWAEVALNISKMERKDTREEIIRNRYDIDSTVKEFVKLVFGE